MTQVSNERYIAILAEADRAHDSDEITLADNHLIVKKLNEGEFETAEKMLTDAKEFGTYILTFTHFFNFVINL